MIVTFNERRMNKVYYYKQTRCGSNMCNSHDAHSYTPCQSQLLENKYSLAMAYVPVQRWEEPMPLGVALKKGTIFACLDLPFLGSNRRKCHG